jgi:PST family polysaccharide transporter
MTLIKTSILTAISTIIKILSGFVINKIMAVYVGPNGIALVGHFRNFISIVTTFSNGAITQGVVKYTAEYQELEKKTKIFSTSIIISLFCSIIIAIFVFAFRDYLSELILKDKTYSDVFAIFAITIFLFSLNSVFLSILNGQKEIKKYIAVNISSSLFSLFFTSFLVYKWHLHGALYAMVLNQSVIFFITLVFVIKSHWFRCKYFINWIDKDSFIKLIKFSLMAITSAIIVSGSQMIIRDYIGSNLGWNKAGYWQGIFYISEVYLVIVTTSLSVYYLPRLSEIKDKSELKKEIINGYKIIMPIVIFLAFMIFLLKDFIVLILFSEKFLPMIELFKWQLIGDVIKIASWLLSYLMLAKAMTKLFIISEIIFGSSWVILSIVCIKYFGLIGVTYAFSLNYFFYLIFVLIYFRKVLI